MRDHGRAAFPRSSGVLMIMFNTPPHQTELEKWSLVTPVTSSTPEVKSTVCSRSQANHAAPTWAQTQDNFLIYFKQDQCQVVRGGSSAPACARRRRALPPCPAARRCAGLRAVNREVHQPADAQCRAAPASGGAAIGRTRLVGKCAMAPTPPDSECNRP